MREEFRYPDKAHALQQARHRRVREVVVVVVVVVLVWVVVMMTALLVVVVLVVVVRVMVRVEGDFCSARACAAGGLLELAYSPWRELLRSPSKQKCWLGAGQESPWKPDPSEFKALPEKHLAHRSNNIRGMKKRSLHKKRRQAKEDSSRSVVWSYTHKLIIQQTPHWSLGSFLHFFRRPQVHKVLHAAKVALHRVITEQAGLEQQPSEGCLVYIRPQAQLACRQVAHTCVGGNAMLRTPHPLSAQ